MELSVILAVRDGAAYLQAAIDSVLAEPEVAELIVVDDGSVDATADIVRGYAARVVSLWQPPSGQAAAINRGLAVAAGDVLAFHDADDLWLPGRVAALAAPLAGYDGSYGKMEQFVSPDLDPALAASTRIDTTIRPSRMITAMLIRRDAFVRVGGLDERLQTGANIDWVARATAAGLRFVEVDHLVTRRRIHATNLGRTVGAAARNVDLLNIVRAHVARQRLAEEPA